ncbi:NAD(P)H-hydrate dehydratase [Sphingomonas sp. MMS24-J13]|uniref:NAD(P)H-hydrate dehydratase n=1 Tax=Sphingomonas sp. MMS24-J13 TaxID=3238686 RepID=UPI00384F06A2
MRRIVLTAAETRAAEEAVMATGVSVETLMERAGAAVADVAWRVAGPIETLILCGPGNNGGDGYVVARLLAERGAQVRVACLGAPRTEAARKAAARWTGPISDLAEAKPAPLLIDALFGTGLSRGLDSDVAAVLDHMVKRSQRSIAVDLPSGVDTDRGRLLSAVPGFDMTVALGVLKPSHRLLPAAGTCGRVVLGEIGLAAAEPKLGEIARPRLARPSVDDHKYSRGKVLVVGGAMGGAALLAATAAQRAGAGYVELAGDWGGIAPHSLVRHVWDDKALEDERIGAIVIGPGLGRDGDARARLDAVLASGRKLVIDADALTLIGKARHDRLKGAILTPHWGEFTRLFGDDGGDRLSQARGAAAASGAIVILKGADSIVAHPDGRAAIAPLAPTWLASAGTGDVLAGIVGAMLAGGRDPFEAAQAALWLHAEAARLAGPMLLADDLVEKLPHAAMACL